MNKYLKYTLIAGGILLTGYLCKKAYVSIKEDLKQAAIQRRIEEAARREAIEKFELLKDKFKTKATDSNISAVTLMNKNVTKIEDRSYLYDKLTDYKESALSCDYDHTEQFDNCVNEYNSLYGLLHSDSADEEVINARLVSLRNQDARINEIKQRKLQEAIERRKHQQELDILNQKHKADLETYEAKAEIEKAKLKTICAAMGGNDSNKNISTQLNIKADLKED